MVRKATLDRDLRPDDRAASDEAEPGLPASPARRPEFRWRGAGGRWLVWVFRVVVWAVLLIIGYRGITGIVAGPQRASPASVSPAAAAPDGFPAQLAEAYALQFGNVYLNSSRRRCGQGALSRSPRRPLWSRLCLWSWRGRRARRSSRARNPARRSHAHSNLARLPLGERPRSFACKRPTRLLTKKFSAQSQIKKGTAHAVPTYQQLD